MKILFVFAVIISFYTANAQDSIQSTQDSTITNLFSGDSINIKKDTTLKSVNKDQLKAKVKYAAKDSIVVDLKEHKIYLYGGAEITYETINVKAALIEINFGKNEMFASGIMDSTGKLVGIPEFTEEKESFTSDNMIYNFKSKKGIVRHLFTKEGEGYLHGNKVKKLSNNVTFINTGSYTTCDKKKPDYEIRFIKAKVIPDDKIICGPALLFIEGVPVPLGLPFGYFPVKKGRRSGLLLPSYGETANRGFYFENGGYYWGINDYSDLSIRGDIYTRGSWATKTTFNYNKLYHYNGSLDLNYAYNKIPEPNSDVSSVNKDFFIRWLYNQSDKARPHSRFSANVNAGSSSYNTLNPSSTSDYLTNTFQSTISYSTVIADNYNFSINMRHIQNTQTKDINITLPEITFSANRFYPFQKKERVGKPKWYENISINYVMNAKNELNTKTSYLFTPHELDSLNYGVLHTITASSSNKILKHLSWTNTLSFNDRFYFDQTQKEFRNDSVISKKNKRFSSPWDVSYSSSVSTRLYGIFQFKHGPIKAIRHVITPNLGFSLTPGFSQYWKQYYNSVYKENVSYSAYEDNLYSTPPAKKSGMLNFSLSNNLEMKVKSSKDTITGFKKIVLIENFTISESYDLAKDSLQWSRLSMSGHTRLLKNIDLRYSSIWDPYVIDSLGRNRNKFEWNVNKRLYRRENTNWGLSINWNLSSKSKPTAIPNQPKTGTQQPIIIEGKDKNKQPETPDKNTEIPSTDFNIPWNLNIYYTFQWTSNFNAAKRDFTKTSVQTLAFNGDINLTKKWKIGITSGYDFQSHGFSYTSVNIYRDLHCWEMIFNWIPVGFRKSYNFTLRIKASLLQDLKLIKKTDWRDKQY